MKLGRRAQNTVAIVATLLFAAPMVATGVSYADGWTATTAVTAAGGQIHIPAVEATTAAPVVEAQSDPQLPVPAEPPPPPPADVVEAQPPAEPTAPGTATQPADPPPAVEIPIPGIGLPTHGAPGEPGGPDSEEPASP